MGTAGMGAAAASQNPSHSVDHDLTSPVDKHSVEWLLFKLSETEKQEAIRKRRKIECLKKIKRSRSVSSGTRTPPSKASQHLNSLEHGSDTNNVDHESLTKSPVASTLSITINKRCWANEDQRTNRPTLSGSEVTQRVAAAG